MIELIHLSRRFGRTAALDDLTLRVERGEKVAVLGPSGAGKTTLLRVLAGCLAPSAGTVRVAGHDLARESLAARRRLGYLPENSPVHPELRVGEYLRYRAALKGLDGRARQQRIRALLGPCGLRGLEGALLANLSKGETRRVLVADCLLADPDVVIMDEPSLGLDAQHEDSFRTLVRGLRAEQTLLLATHSLDEARALCGRVLVLNRGRLALLAAASPLLDNRRSLAEVFAEAAGAGAGGAA